MEKKYLPIGSVCKLKGKNKQIMITGYYSVEFSGNFKIKDYSGCAYPEGLLLPEQTTTFNHSDIETIEFIGYKSEEEKVFQNLLNRLTGNGTLEEQASDFHKNDDMFLASSTAFSKLLFDENGVVMIAEPAEQLKPETNSLLKGLKFDENGVVISDNSKVENPFYTKYDYSTPKKVDKKPSNSIFKDIEFDENGVVVSANDNNAKLEDIEFDENGIVISIGKEQLEKKYNFDKNGVLISDGIDEYIPPIGPGLPGYEKAAKEKKYNFDKNGVLISDGTDEYIPPIGPGLPGYVEQKKENKYQFDEDGTVISE